MRYRDVLIKIAEEDPVVAGINAKSEVPVWRPDDNQYRHIKDKAHEYGLQGAKLINKQNRPAINGMGGDGQTGIKTLAKWWFPESLLPASIHDIRYTIGGTEEDREIADQEFFDNLQNTAVQRYGPDNFSKWYENNGTKLKNWARRTILPHVGYWAVRLGGEDNFKYTPEAQAKRQVAEQAKQEQAQQMAELYNPNYGDIEY